jgi:hypothetical protein
MWLKAEKARIIIMSSLRCFKPKGKMYYCLICLQSINTFLLSFNLEPPICGTCLVKKAKPLNSTTDLIKPTAGMVIKSRFIKQTNCYISEIQIIGDALS